MERKSIFRSLSGSGGLPSLKTITEDGEEDRYVITHAAN